MPRCMMLVRVWELCAGFVIDDQAMSEKLKALEKDYLKEAMQNPGPDVLNPRFEVANLKAGFRR